MAKYHKDFDELLAKKMKDISFAQAYLQHLVNEEELSIAEALRQTIIAMGIQAFCKKANVSIAYISDFVRKKKTISQETLYKHIQKVFKLKPRIHLISKHAA